MRSTILSVLMLIIGITGQEALSQQTVSLDDAIQMAVENNRELKIAKLEMDKADYQVREAFGLALPNLNASADYIRSLERPVFFLPDFQNPGSDAVVPIQIGSRHSLRMGFEATQTIFNAAVFTGIGTAKIYQKASREQYTTAYQNTVAEARRAFYRVLFVKDVVEMMRASLKNAEDNLDNVELLNKQGIVSDYDLIRADVQVENIRPTVTQAERNVVLAENALKIVMGLDPGEAINVSGEMEYVPITKETVDLAEQMLIENNSSLKALDYRMQVNDELVSIEKSSYIPTVTAFGNYQWQNENDDLGKLTDNLIASSQVGINVSVNIFNGFQTTAKVDQAEVELRKSEEQLKYTTDAMVTQVQSIRYRLEEAEKRVKAQGRTVEQAEKGYKIATTRYKTGSGTQLEVKDADLALMQARVNRAQAIYDYNIAKIDLEEILNLQE